MNETPKGCIPIEAVVNGRDMGEVISRYVEYHTSARKYAEENGVRPDEIFVEAMTTAICRIYLLGVEDGMKGAKQ